MDKPRGYHDILLKIKHDYSEILQDNLVGVYIHGSIAFNCFNWDKSDIDFIVVIDRPMSVETKVKLMDITIELNRYAPAKGIEMSVVLKKYCLKFMYPTPFELHFSKAHVEWYRNDPYDYCEKMNGEDKDIAAHFMVIKNVGIALCGEKIHDVFGSVPKNDYIDSIKFDIEEAKKDIFDNPIYVILNLCRALAYIKDALILSKEQGAAWGIECLPSEFKDLIYEATACYKSDTEMIIEENAAINFTNYALSLIF